MSSATRNLRRMLACIEALRSGRSSLPEAVANLSFLDAALDAGDHAWSEAFLAHLTTLESAGLASPEQIRGMGQQYEGVVKEATDGIERLVRDLLATVPAEQDEAGDEH